MSGSRSRVALGAALLTGLFLLPAGCLKDDVESRFTRGEKLLFENRHEEAERHYLALAGDMARSDLPGAAGYQARALFQVGRIEHLYLDQPRRSVGRLREAIKIDPDADFVFDARVELGNIFQDRLGDYRSAALEYERLVHEFPDHPGIDAYQYRVAQAYYLVSDFDQARAEARILIKKWSEGRFADEARLLIANSYYLQNRFGEAAKAHQELLDSDPDVPIRARSLFELGICYQDMGEKQKAEEAFLAALKDHPRPDLVQMQLAALRKRIIEENDQAQPLDYATAGSHYAPRPQPDGGTDAAAQPKADPKPKADPAPAPKPGPKPKVDSAPAGQPAADPAAKPAGKPAAKPAPDPAAKPAADPAPKPTPKPTPKPAPAAAPGPKPAPAKDPKPAPSGSP